MRMAKGSGRIERVAHLKVVVQGDDVPVSLGHAFEDGDFVADLSRRDEMSPGSKSARERGVCGECGCGGRVCVGGRDLARW